MGLIEDGRALVTGEGPHGGAGGDGSGYGCLNLFASSFKDCSGNAAVERNSDSTGIRGTDRGSADPHRIFDHA